MTEVIGVRFNKVSKIYYFDPNGHKANLGDGVIVETARGTEFGTVAIVNREVKDEELVAPLKPIIRIATREDYNTLENNKRKEKEAYDIALKKNPNMVYINLNLAQWYFFAPAFGGGSKKKANELFQVALKNATEKGEKFYVNLIYSQFMYDQKDKKAATEYLNNAYALQPDSQKVAFLKLLNENDFTLFYYTLNRAKVEKKLGL